jgi:hypothetical protein
LWSSYRSARKSPRDRRRPEAIRSTIFSACPRESCSKARGFPARFPATRRGRSRSLRFFIPIAPIQTAVRLPGTRSRQCGKASSRAPNCTDESGLHQSRPSAGYAGDADGFCTPLRSERVHRALAFPHHLFQFISQTRTARHGRGDFHRSRRRAVAAWS